MKNNFNKSNKLQSYIAPNKSITSELEHERLDASEKQLIIEKLRSFPALGMSYLKSYVPFVEGSSFSDANQSARLLLLESLKTPEFFELCQRRNVRGEHVFAVYDDGRLYAFPLGPDAGASQPAIDLELDREKFTEFQSDIWDVAAMANDTGDVVYSIDEMTVEQWLTFHQFRVPSNKTETSRLLAFLELAPLTSPPLGNFWEVLSATENHPVFLSPESKSALRAITEDITSAPNSLLQTLGRQPLRGKTAAYIRDNADALINQMLSTELADECAPMYLEALGWHGAGDSETADVEQLRQLVITAMLLDLKPDIESSRSANHLAGYDIYSPDNVEKSVSAVRAELEQHLVTQYQYTSELAALAAHLLLAGHAPEFLVKELPEDLLLGNMDWVVFRQGVSLAEIRAPGCSRVMSYQSIKTLGEIEPVTKSQESIHGLIISDVVLDWALLHGVSDQSSTQDSPKTTLATALKAFKRNADLLESAAQTLSTPLPTRRGIAQKILRTLVSDHEFIEQPVLYAKQGRYDEFFSQPMALSMVDLHMSNHLRTQEWDVKNGTGIFKKFPILLKELPAPNFPFDLEFGRAYTLQKSALATTFKLAMAALPARDRFRLQHANVTVFTLRPSVTKHDKRDIYQHPLAAATSSKYPDPVENQRDKDAATGRYGVVLCAEVEGEVFCYELFTLYGECRANPQLAQTIVSNGLLDTESRLDFTGNITTYTTPTPIYELPLNLEHYTHGIKPEGDTQTQGVIEKLGNIPRASKPEAYRSSYQSFYSAQINNIAEFVVNHRPILTRKELRDNAWGQTALEAAMETSEQRFETFLNIVIPFKACIEDLSSGDADRERDAVAGCTLEVVATLLTVFAAGAKLVQIAAKSASITSKVANLALNTTLLIISAINPLDGLPAAFTGGAKFLGKGIWRLSKPGRELLETAMAQLRRLTHSGSYDLVEVTRRLETSQGTWKVINGDTTVLWAVRSHDDWYALNLRTGEPWGPRLSNAQNARFLLRSALLKVVPESFAFSYVKKSLPIAEQKIGTALQQLLTASDEFEVRSVLKYVFGNDSPETVKHLSEMLRTMKKDISHVSMNNVLLDKVPDEHAMAAMFPGRFAVWKAGNYQADALHSKFLHIYTGEMTSYYQSTKFDKGRVADGIVHEMSHGSLDTLDLMYGNLVSVGKKPGHVDVTQLMNLAKKPRGFKTDLLQEANEDGFIEFLQIKDTLPAHLANSPALLNADSHALAVSLLNQRSTNPERFAKNIALMEAKHFASKGEHIKDAVVVDLSAL